MAVSLAVTLPDQPVGGGLEFIPLGGDGFSAPQSAYVVNMDIAGDVSGGLSTLTINFDPQFVGLVSYMQTTVSGVAADTISRRQINLSTGESINDNRALILGEATQANMNWLPPGVLAYDNGTFTPTMISRVANVDGDSHFLVTRIYNFNKRAREISPLYLFMLNLPR